MLKGLRSIFPTVAVVTALIVGTLSHEANATLRRTAGSWLFGPEPVWTDGTTNPTWHALSQPMSSAGLLKVRVSTELEETSANCKIRPAIRWSNDGISWDSDVNLVAGYRTTVGSDFGSTYIDLMALGTPKPWVQFGVQAANNSGVRVEICRATLLVEPESAL